MYPIHSGEHTNTNNPSPTSGEGIEFGTLAQYTDADLITDPSAGKGPWNWCQETPNSSTGSRVRRSVSGVSHLSWYIASGMTVSGGWRPVLELVD